MKKGKYSSLIILSFVQLFVQLSCNSPEVSVSKVQSDSTISTTGDTANIKEYTVGAVLYQQESGEYRALAYQAFKLARMIVQDTLRANKKIEKWKFAVIVDLDETVINNNPYDVRQINKSTYDADQKYHNEWMSIAKADSVPGAYSFLKFLDNNFITIAYVTNRGASFRDSTLSNLIKLGYPQADTDHIHMYADGGNKQLRFDTIASRHRLILQMGDNLNDFSGNFFHRSNADRRHVVDSLYHKIGVQYIALPNPMYGDWETAIYPSPSVSAAQKNDLRKKTLKDY